MSHPTSPPPKHILFLTSANMASNPRCLKEIRLLQPGTIKVTVVAFDLHNWTDEKEAEINKELGDVTFHYLESLRYDLGPWLFSSLLERTARLFLPVLSRSTFWPAMAVNKRGWLLLRWVRRTTIKPDLVIAHNPPAFYAAATLGTKENIPYALDVEDFHPGEGNDKRQQSAVTVLMRRLYKRAAYISYASPLIQRSCERLLPAERPPSFVVNNVFPSRDFRYSSREDGAKLKIVWFSQFVDYGRGLEKIFPALDRHSEKIELSLIGAKREPFYERELKDRDYIRCIPSLSQRQLHEELGQYDVGLALEDGTADLNRNVCLTNKIWSYLQAGLYIVATDTEAQQLFLTEYARHGVCTSLSPDAFGDTLSRLLANKDDVFAGRQQRFDSVASAGWENESLILKKTWGKFLQ
jgi:glycosyltransferase involved in cell wall biosynthesis